MSLRSTVHDLVRTHHELAKPGHGLYVICAPPAWWPGRKHYVDFFPDPSYPRCYPVPHKVLPDGDSLFTHMIKADGAAAALALLTEHYAEGTCRGWRHAKGRP